MGSQDGYICDYDFFGAVNGKTFLTAPQCTHCAVVENRMKAGLLRMWWENPGAPGTGAMDAVAANTSHSPATGLAMHSGGTQVNANANCQHASFLHLALTDQSLANTFSLLRHRAVPTATLLFLLSCVSTYTFTASFTFHISLVPWRKKLGSLMLDWAERTH
jgi:hypothetical protein